jgi:hypothetical protein
MPATYSKLANWSEKLITWVYAPCVIGLFALFFLGLESLMIIPLAGLGLGSAALFVIYIWRIIV